MNFESVLKDIESRIARGEDVTLNEIFFRANVKKRKSREALTRAIQQYYFISYGGKLEPKDKKKEKGKKR